MLNLKESISISKSNLRKFSLNNLTNLTKFSFSLRSRQNANSNKLKFKNTNNSNNTNENLDLLNKTQNIKFDLLNEIKKSPQRIEEINKIFNASLKLVNKIEHKSSSESDYDYSKFEKAEFIQNDRNEAQKINSNVQTINKNLGILYQEKQKEYNNTYKLNECEDIIKMSKGSYNENSVNKNNNPIAASISAKKNFINNSHIAEAHYYLMPFTNEFIATHKYTESFFKDRPRNADLQQEFDHEEELLNNETNKIISDIIKKELKDFKLSDIKANSSMFNDIMKNPDPVGYLMPESNRDVDYDYGTELERLYYIVNKEDDFGVTMYNDEGDKKKPKEDNEVHESEDSNKAMSYKKSFPFVIDNNTMSLLTSKVKL